MVIDSIRKMLKIPMILIILLLVSCEERYTPELNGNYQNVLVVDGKITNGAPPYTVKLSLSSNVEGPQYITLSGYEVKIVDDLGNIEILLETEDGTYMTSPDGMQGTIGRKYKITLKSPEGKTYESGFEEIKNPVGIDSVYAEIEYQQTEEPPFNIPGYQFYIDTELGQSDSTWILWSLDETYQYESDYLATFYYDGILHEFPNTDSLKTCWKSEKVFPFFVESTIGLSEPRFTQYPFHFVSTETRKLSIRYSLMVNQYTINKETYTYWNGVKTQNAGAGELYYTQPYQLKGNVYNTGDGDELVLGFFMVAGLAQKRIYKNQPDESVEMLYPICMLSQPDYENYGWMFIGEPPPNTQYITTDASGRNALPNQSCIDCRKKGGKLAKPDWWEDE